MTIEEYYAFINSLGTTLLNPPIHPFKSEWAKIYNDIKPHFFGDVPPALERAFPNEDNEILNYRKNTYQPKTESPLVKAITELGRLLSNAKHSVKFDNKDMQEYFENNKFGDQTIIRYFFNMFVPNRILDPNAVMLVMPTGAGLETDTERVDIELKIIQSDRIIFNDPDYKLLIYKGTNKSKYAAIGAAAPNYYYVVTDMFFAEIKPVQDNQNFIVTYEHNTGVMPWVTLGGRSVPKHDFYGNTFHIFKSDFSPAIPYLNDAAIFDNQHKSVMLATCFPVKFVEGVDCKTCFGTGRCVDPHNSDNSITCGTCHGNGKTLSITPLAAYNINPSTNKFREGEVGVDPIRYFSPDVSTIVETGKVATAALDKAEQVLNINRSLKSAQSGVAKEMDREPEYIEVGKISDDVYARMKDTLEIIQALRFMDTESSIIVNAPISFDLKTEIELMLEFAESQKGQPAAIRFEAYISYMDRRFSADPIARRIAEICAMYISLYLYTVDERNTLLASGQCTQEDSIKATFVFDAITSIYFDQNFDIMTDDWNAIKTRIDAELAPRFAAQRSNVLPEIEVLPNDDNNHDSPDDNM